MTEDNQYTEHSLKVARTARWGHIGSLDETTSGIWIVLHGYGQLAAEFAGSAQWSPRPRTSIVFPEALQRFYAGPPDSPHATAPVGASWMTRDARLDDIADNHAYLDTLVAALLEHAPNATFGVLGFSQGAATAARWAAERAARGEPLRALVLWGALCPPDVDLSPKAPLGVTALRYVCGRKDRWVTAERLEGEWKRLAAAGRAYEVTTFDGGHRLDNASLPAALTGL